MQRRGLRRHKLSRPKVPGKQEIRRQRREEPRREPSSSSVPKVEKCRNHVEKIHQQSKLGAASMVYK